MRSQQSQARRKVLVVEDNEENLAVYKAILTHVGYIVIEAITGEDALVKARNELPDIITMDISLPGIDGLEATRILKKDVATKHIPIVALTAHALEVDRQRAIAAGMDGYLAKPVEPRRVIQEIERFIGPPVLSEHDAPQEPQDNARASAQRPRTRPMPEPTAIPGKLLVVDSNSDNIEIISVRLRLRGYDVITGSTGRDALALSSEVDLVLMDASLPDMDGFTVCEELKLQDPLKQIILVTALDTTEDKITGLRSGADDYLTKPINFPELEAMVYSRLRLVVQLKALRQGINGKLQPHDHSITVSFVFPEHVRTSCEQYLLYFGEFLRDVGIRASTDLRHEAGEALFSVTPEDPHTALGKVRRALDIYLRFPDQPEFSHALQDAGDVRALQLLANIHTLHAQFTYARAALEAKDETIAALQGRLADMISPNSVTAMLPAGEGTVFADKVDFLGGTVELVPWEGKGLKVDTPRIFRWLRSLIERDD